MSDDKLIINVALTGMVPTKADNPHLPVTPDEIADEVVRCYNAGGSIFHIHARDEDETPTYQREVFHDIMRSIRQKCKDDLILCVTTSGRLFNTFEARSQVLDLEGDVRHLLNNPGQGTAFPIPHPLNAKRIGFVVCAIDIVAR